MSDYWWGVTTVLGVVYLGFGIFMTVDAVRFSRPSQLRHTQSTLARGAFSRQGWVFWPSVAVAPVLWPLVAVLTRWDVAAARNRHNKAVERLNSTTAGA